MPGFASVLSSEAIWDLIDYLHADNAGYAKHATGQWPWPVAMPQFDALCADGRDLDLDDLRGRPMLIIAGDPATAPQLPNATTILVSRNPRAKLTACVAGEPQVWTALSIILGVSPDALSGTEILVDANGWLRATWHPGDSENWSNPDVLAAKLQDVAAHPLVVYVPGGHIHHQG